MNINPAFLIFLKYKICKPTDTIIKIMEQIEVFTI